MACSWCGQELSFLSALRGNRYCSEEHKRLDAEEMKSLGIRRLLEAFVREDKEIERCEPAVKS
jgi:hypothetical protein